MQAPGLLIILTGPTASGKDALMHKLLNINPNWSRIITTTTRLPRNGEQSGKDYYFTDQETFKKMQQAGEFLETVQYAGNFYGTTKKEIEQVLNGKNMIWRIDPTMAAQVSEYFYQVFDKDMAKKLLDNTKTLFITVPDISTLYRRLEKRGMDAESVKLRLKTDEENWEKLQSKFEHIVINTDGALDQTVNKVMEIMAAEDRK